MLINVTTLLSFEIVVIGIPFAVCDSPAHFVAVALALIIGASALMVYGHRVSAQIADAVGAMLYHHCRKDG
jgi:hypothetical protein